MLTHEEMIENVHRRIAQYEEEQKMKHSKNIKFFSAKQDIKTEENRTNEDGYIEVASGTDRVRPANNVLRMISSVAAAAVIFTAIGATGYLMKRNKADSTKNSDTSLTEAAESDLTMLISDNSVSPFGDFNQLVFSLSVLNQPYKEYSDDTCNKLAAFLNGFNWGEETAIAEYDIPDIDEYEGEGYGIFWKKGDAYFDIFITEDGKAYYMKTKCDPDGGSFYYPVTESLVFNIDYNSFDNGIKDILQQDVPDKGEKLSQMEIKRLSEGEFRNAYVNYEMNSESETITPEKPETQAALSNFLEKDFLTMLKKEGTANYQDGELMYMVVRFFKSSDTTVRRESFFIYTNGFVNLCSYELTDKDEIPTGTWNYNIDTAEFETRLNDILAGNYDEAVTEKKEEKNAPKKENVQPATTAPEKQENVHQAAAPHNTDENISEGSGENEPDTGLVHTANEGGVQVFHNTSEEVYDYYTDRNPHVAILDDNDEIIASSRTHDHKKLDDFVANTFEKMLTELTDEEKERASYSSIDESYCIFRIYIDENNNIIRCGYSVCDNDTSALCAYRFREDINNWEPCGAYNYHIDYSEFKKLFDEAIKNAKK